MMHLTFADKTLLVGDEIAELIIEYAAALARNSDADTVKVLAYGADGDKVEAMLLLDEGVLLMGETTHSDLPEPDNEGVAAYVRGRLADIASPPTAQPVAEEENALAAYEEEFDGDPGGRRST